MPVSHRARNAILLSILAIVAFGNGCAATARDQLASLPSAITAERQNVQAVSHATILHDESLAEVESTPSRVAENLQRGRLEAEAGRHDQAAKFFERVLRDDPENADAHHLLAVVSDQLGDFPRSERHYLAALDLRPTDGNLLNDLGYSYFLQSRISEAERIFRSALSADPAHERARNNLKLLDERLARVRSDEAVQQVAYAEHVGRGYWLREPSLDASEPARSTARPVRAPGLIEPGTATNASPPLLRSWLREEIQPYIRTNYWDSSQPSLAEGELSHRQELPLWDDTSLMKPQSGLKGHGQPQATRIHEVSSGLPVSAPTGHSGPALQ